MKNVENVNVNVNLKNEVMKNLKIDFEGLKKDELLEVKKELERLLRECKGLIKGESYEGFVSMEEFSERLGIKLSSMRSRYMVYMLEYGIKYEKFEGDKGYWWKEEDVEKVVEGVEKKRMERIRRK